MAKKAKWLEGSTLSIAEAIVAALTAEEVTEKEITKALKGAQEIQERVALDEAEPTVQGILAKVVGLGENVANMANAANDLYKADLEAAGESVDPVDEEDSEEGEAPRVEKKKSKKDKKDKAAEVEEIDYESMSKKALRLAAKEAGVKVNKKMEKEELIEALKSAK